MKKILCLNEIQNCFSIQSDKIFCVVDIVSVVERLGESETGVTPSIDFTLMGPKTKFQFSSVRLNNSNQFTYFNLMDVAKEYIDDEYIVFNKLTMSCNNGFYKNKYSIEVELECE